MGQPLQKTCVNSLNGLIFHSHVSSKNNWKCVLANFCTWIFIAAWFLIFKKSKQSKCSPIDKINKMSYIQIFTLYLTIHMLAICQILYTTTRKNFFSITHETFLKCLDLIQISRWFFPALSLTDFELFSFEDSIISQRLTIISWVMIWPPPWQVPVKKSCVE